MTKIQPEQWTLFAKALLYVVFAWLFITNNAHIEWFAKKINHDMIRPYRNRYSVVYIPPTPSDEEPTETPSIPTRGPSVAPQPNIVFVTESPVARTSISEEELWSALNAYRNTHGRHNLNRSESLCQYARKRVNELINRLETTPDDPLDNHAGFQRDADSGYVFEATGFNYVGENLAYTPGFTSATQVIEWGWDTSSGHRELQLSNDITDGCIAASPPIFVGIYGH